jgi:hypothetical protein
MSLAEVKIKGWAALVKDLGYAGATKFMLLYQTGEGDYKRDRKELLGDVPIKEMVKEMKQGTDFDNPQ